MSASRLPKNTPPDEEPPLEAVPGPVARQRAERRWFGAPAHFTLLCLGSALLGAAIGLLATGSWAWGVVALLVAVVLLAGVRGAVRRGGRLWPEQSAQLAAEGRAKTATAAEVWRARLDATVARWRTQSRLDGIELERAPALQTLGDAVWRGDAGAEGKARERLVELDQERERIEEELAEWLAGAEERIRRARLPAQKTLVVTPDE